jgi:8-hydroxy-5-deazaflavin:NADPH oxidoreductase
MRIGVLGTGIVGSTIASKLVALGHEVKMGSRTATNEKAAAWAKGAGAGASHGTFADAAASGEIVWNCTNGKASLDALGAAGAANLRGKVLVDVSNALDFSKGMPPTLFVSNDDSLAERIQRAFPEAKVVKTFNTMNCQLMVDPTRLRQEHDVFLSGNDPEAKAQVGRILREWIGWKNVIDLGDLSTARGTEAWLLLWVRLYGALGTVDFNLHVVR